MTKYILVGGYVQKAEDGGKAFAEELVAGFAEPVKILDCAFARPKERWAELVQNDTEFFQRVLTTKTELKLAQAENFIDQVRWADAIFLRGGFSNQLIDTLAATGDWRSFLGGKTIAGTSAGADALSTYYFGLDHGQVREGLALLPVKVIPHFKSDYHGWEFDWDKAAAELKAYKEDLPLCALREGEFKVFEQ